MMPKFKIYLEKEFNSSKSYKSELKWFDGAWSRFKPGLGKDKRGLSGVDKSKLLKIGKKISEFFWCKNLKPNSMRIALQKIQCYVAASLPPPSSRLQYI